MKTNVAVIYGGRTGEHEVSHRSAKSIVEAIDTDKYKVLHYVISKEGKWSPRPIQPEPGGNPGVDVVFPVLHGTFGEDGTVQGLLELADLPYVGAGVLASSISMDKEMMKRVARERGLPVVDYWIPPQGRVNYTKFENSFPMFVKPANLGSSVGISKVHNLEELLTAVGLASSYDRKVIVER
ncbi:MAG: D-alanine--D-alanine ligase A, partial [Bryobacteraceae bacterium]